MENKKLNWKLKITDRNLLTMIFMLALGSFVILVRNLSPYLQ